MNSLEGLVSGDCFKNPRVGRRFPPAPSGRLALARPAEPAGVRGPAGPSPGCEVGLSGVWGRPSVPRLTPHNTAVLRGSPLGPRAGAVPSLPWGQSPCHVAGHTGHTQGTWAEEAQVPAHTQASRLEPQLRSRAEPGTTRRPPCSKGAFRSSSRKPPTTPNSENPSVSPRPQHPGPLPGRPPGKCAPGPARTRHPARFRRLPGSPAPRPPGAMRRGAGGGGRVLGPRDPRAQRLLPPSVSPFHSIARVV